MITKSEMIPLLLEACPSFAPRWQTFVEERQGKVDLPHYLIFGDLVRHLSAQLKGGQTSEISAFFQGVERLILEGDEYVSEAAVVWILEDLQNPALHSGTKPEQFVPYLGEDSKYWWTKVERFWQTGELIADDRQKDTAEIRWPKQRGH